LEAIVNLSNSVGGAEFVFVGEAVVFAHSIRSMLSSGVPLSVSTMM
jgi:hypothetical protein